MSTITQTAKQEIIKIEDHEMNIKLSSKILLLIKLFNSFNPNTEWSGVLFYKLNENNLNFEIDVVDILFMNICRRRIPYDISVFYSRRRNCFGHLA